MMDIIAKRKNPKSSFTKDKKENEFTNNFSFMIMITLSKYWNKNIHPGGLYNIFIRDFPYFSARQFATT